MPAIPQQPFHRSGVRFTADPAKDVEYVQVQHGEDENNAYRGELFLNESRDEVYYVDNTGVARRFGDRATGPIDASRLDCSDLRLFADDIAAAAANPPVPVGGLYVSSGQLRVRLV